MTKEKIKIDKNARIELDIIDYSSDCQGIAKVDGLVYFVPFALKDERVLAKVEYAKKTYIQTSLVKVLKASPKRIVTECNRFGRCGSCDILEIDYNEQLSIKKQLLINTLSKNYRQPIIVDDVVASPQYAYRNKISLPFGVVNDKVALGFYKLNTHKIVSLTKCFLQGEWVEKLIKVTLDYANSYGLSVYDENTKQGILRHLTARKVNEKIIVAPVVTKKPTGVDDYYKKLAEVFDDIVLYLNYNQGDNNVILGDKTEYVGGKLENTLIRGVSTMINPMSFLQVNDYIRDKIYDEIEKIIASSSANVIIDAYAGVGLLGCALSKSGAKVYNIEIVDAAIKDGNRMIADNGLEDRVTNILGDSAVELPKLLDDFKNNPEKLAVYNMELQDLYYRKIAAETKTFEIRMYDEKRQKIRIGDTITFKNKATEEVILCRVTDLKVFDNFTEMFRSIDLAKCGFEDDIDAESAAETMGTIYSKEKQKKYKTLAIGVQLVEPTFAVILDPPRKGCDLKVLEAINQLNVDKLIYVSCNPATLGRDLEILSAAYSVEKITPYDMFPNTRHIETLCLLRKQ